MKNISIDLLLTLGEIAMDNAEYWKGRDQGKRQKNLNDVVAIDAELESRKPDCEFMDLFDDNGIVGFEVMYGEPL